MQRWLCLVALLFIQLIAPSTASHKTPYEPIECPGGFCIERHLCPNGTYDESGLQTFEVITLRFGEDDDCFNYMKVCCQNVPTKRHVPQPPVNLNVDEDHSECGKDNPRGVLYQLQANRTYAHFGEFPWVVAILTTYTISDERVYEYVCGGTLIHPRFVVSAAHSLEDKTDLVAGFGVWDMENDVTGYNKQMIDIEQQLIFHPNYSQAGLLNDIVLVKLKQDVVYSQHIRPICLPQPTDRFDGKVCTSTGWGLEKNTNNFATVLKRVDLPVIPRETCKDQFAETRLGPFFQLHKSVLCAGGEEGVDMCDGDGGSGLVCRNEADAYVLAGIVSWGLSCFQKNVPGAYVNVARFVPWINEVTEQRV